MKRKSFLLKQSLYTIVNIKFHFIFDLGSYLCNQIKIYHI